MTSTISRRTERNTSFEIAWADRLPFFSTDFDFAPFADAAHSPHQEQPDRATAEIARFLDQPRSRP